MSNQGDDCYFFFYSTCTKGDSCAFRHCEAAVGTETICTLWQEGRCFRQICKFRHMEIDKKRSEIPCYWENQLSGCQKANCAFYHAKGRFVDGAYFPPSKAVEKTEQCQPDVQTTLPSPAPTKLSVAPTPQLRAVIKMEATENVPSPTHPPVVINAADDDEDDDDQFSEEGEEMKNSSQQSGAPGNQYGTHLVSTRKSLTPKKDASAVPEIFVSSYNQIDNNISVVRTVKFTSKDSTTKLSLAQRLGKPRKYQGDQSLAGGEVLPFMKKTLSERLGKRITASTDSPEFQPKKVQIPRLLKDRLGMPTEQSSIEMETAANAGSDFRIKTLQEIRHEKANQRLEQEATSLPSRSEEKVSMKSKLSSKSQTAIYIKSLSEIQEEKRLRQLKDETLKRENMKDEQDSMVDNELEPKESGNTVQNYTVPIESTQKQADLNWKVQGESKIKRPIVNDNISSDVGTTKPLSVTLKGQKRSLPSIEKVRIKTLEEIKQEKALRLQQTEKSENVESVSQPRAPSNPKKILRLPILSGSTDAKPDPSTAEPSLPTNKAAEEEKRTLVTFRSPVKTSEKIQSKKSVDAKTGHNTLIADCRTSPVKDGNDTEVLKPTVRTLEKKDKPKLNVEPCVVKNTLPVKAAMKRKAPERTAVAEVKPMSSAITCSEDQKAPGMAPVIEYSEEGTMDSRPPKQLKISLQANTPLPSISATVQAPLKSPRTSTASMGKTSVATEDEFDELMWDISDDKLEGELDLDSNKDEDALLLELSKMIDS